MDLEEFEIDGKKIVLNTDFNEDETGIAFKDSDDEFEHTKEIEVINDEELFGETLTNVFGEDNHE